MVNEHEALLAQVMPWWKSKGWNPSTLQRKSVNELLGIRNRMLHWSR